MISERPFETIKIEGAAHETIRTGTDGTLSEQLIRSVWLYYKDQKLDITNRFKDGICYVKLTDGKDIMYLTVKYKNGYAMSDSKYLSPREFN